MKTLSNSSRSRFAFTLIELLTVIAIIAILMGLLFPAIGAVRENARRTQAKNEVTQLVAALKHYYTEYSKYPPLEAASAAAPATPPANPKDLYCGDKLRDTNCTFNNVAVMDTLRAISRKDGVNENDAANPRRIPFYEAKIVQNPLLPRSGVLEVSSSGVQPTNPEQIGCLFDPWGNQYFIMMDTNYDNALDMGQCYKDFGETDELQKPRTGVGAFSVGKDNALGDLKKFPGVYRQGTEVCDDVISWQ